MKRTILILALLSAIACVPHHVVGSEGAPAIAPHEARDPRWLGMSAEPQVMYRWPLDLPGNRRTSINVSGEDGGDIDCYLYSGDFRTHNAAFIVRDDSPRNGCRFDVTPPCSGPYVLLVQNTGDRVEHYTIVIR